MNLWRVPQHSDHANIADDHRWPGNRLTEFFFICSITIVILQMLLNRTVVWDDSALARMRYSTRHLAS